MSRTGASILLLCLLPVFTGWFRFIKWCLTHRDLKPVWIHSKADPRWFTELTCNRLFVNSRHCLVKADRHIIWSCDPAVVLFRCCNRSSASSPPRLLSFLASSLSRSRSSSLTEPLPLSAVMWSMTSRRCRWFHVCFCPLTSSWCASQTGSASLTQRVMFQGKREKRGMFESDQDFLKWLNTFRN